MYSEIRNHKVDDGFSYEDILKCQEKIEAEIRVVSLDETKDEKPIFVRL